MRVVTPLNFWVSRFRHRFTLECWCWFYFRRCGSCGVGGGGSSHVRDPWTIMRRTRLAAYLIRTRVSVSLSVSVSLTVTVTVPVLFLCFFQSTDNKEVIIDRPIGLATNYETYQRFGNQIKQSTPVVLHLFLHLHRHLLRR